MRKSGGGRRDRGKGREWDRGKLVDVDRMPQNSMMRPLSSHPGQFNGQLTPQQMEAMTANGSMQNGAWRGPPQKRNLMLAWPT